MTESLFQIFGKVESRFYLVSFILVAIFGSSYQYIFRQTALVKLLKSFENALTGHLNTLLLSYYSDTSDLENCFWKS